MNTPPPSFSKEVSWGLGANGSYATRWAQSVSTGPSVTPTNEGERPFDPHMTLRPTTMLNIDKHPANKRPVVSEMTMTFLFRGPANKQTSHRKWARVRLLVQQAAPLSKLDPERVTDQLISTLKTCFLGFWHWQRSCHGAQSNSR